MRIKMKTTLAGPNFTAKPGEEIEVPEEQGYDLINGRYAELCPILATPSSDDLEPDDGSEDSEDSPEETEVETAEASQGENAAAQTDKPKPRRRSAPKK